MQNSFARFGGNSAIITGVLSIAYAIFFLGVTRVAPALGNIGSWVILAASGIFSSAAFVAIYQRLRAREDSGFALWALLLGVISSYLTLTHGAYEALVLIGTPEATHGLSEVDPSGLSAFFVVGIVALILNWLFLQTGLFPKNLAYLGLLNAVLLIVLYFASAFGITPLILLAGGLTSVIVGPLWWIWVGRNLLSSA